MGGTKCLQEPGGRGGGCRQPWKQVSWPNPGKATINTVSFSSVVQTNTGIMQTNSSDDDSSVYWCLGVWWWWGGGADNRENKGRNITVLTKPSQSNRVFLIFFFNLYHSKTSVLKRSAKEDADNIKLRSLLRMLRGSLWILL